MKSRYLPVTYRKGKPVAAYLHLPRPVGIKTARTIVVAEGLLADFGPDGEPLGIEIVSPSTVTAEQLDTALESLNVRRLSRDEFAPLAA